jgi:hypothetical protein
LITLRRGVWVLFYWGLAGSLANLWGEGLGVAWG